MFANERKIGIIGGDLRLLEVAERLASVGFEVAIFGINADHLDASSSVTRAATIDDATEKSEVIVCPIVFSRDGINIDTPLFNGKIKITELTERISEKQLLFAGSLSKSVEEDLNKRNISYYDYGKSEEVQIPGARATAESAVAISILNSGKTLRDSSVAILGYGRIGKMLASLLLGFGSVPTVFARSRESLVLIRENGFLPRRFGSIADGCTEKIKYDIVFNTVPAWYYEEIKGLVNDNGLFVDLASVYGKAVFDDFTAINASGLPGKYCPVSSGAAVFNCLYSLLKPEDV